MKNTNTQTLQTQTGTRIRKIVRIMCVMMICVALLSCVALAEDGKAADAGGAIQTGVKTGTRQLYTIIQSVVTPIAGLIFAFNALRLFGPERDVETAVKRMLLCAGAIALVFLAPAIVSQVSTWFTPDTTIFT